MSDAHIKKLNVIQNTCLRVAIGARKTSSISSLEVESFIPPLCLHRKENIMKCYCRINQLPLELPLCEELLENNINLVMRPWAGCVIVPPLVIRCEHYVFDNNLNFINAIPSTITSPLAPWI